MCPFIDRYTLVANAYRSGQGQFLAFAIMNPTQRQRNLKLLIEQWGGAGGLSAKLGYSNASYISHLTTGHRPITEKTARKIETVLGLPLSWMDADHATRPTSRRNNADVLSAGTKIDTELFSRVTAGVISVLEERETKLDVRKFEKIVTVLYKCAVGSGDALDAGFINDLVDLAE